MSKLILINLTIQLYIIYCSCVSMSDPPLSNKGEEMRESDKEEGNSNSSKRETTVASGKGETVEEVTTPENMMGLSLTQTTRSSPKDITQEFERETTAQLNIVEKPIAKDIRGKISETIETFCPLVDICDANSSNAELNRNGIVVRGSVSCCQGCSCHPNCKDRMNCCYPEDYNTTDNPVEFTTPYQCLYTRLGRDVHIDGTVSSYRTIVSAPKGGCVNSRPLRVTPDVLLYPTCDDVNVTALGPYFPVYSKETGNIYRNILCARCHGVRITELFQANLVCERNAVIRRSQISMSENLNFLDSGKLSPKCYVDFKFNKTIELHNERCFRDLIATCTVKNSTRLLERLKESPTNLDIGMVQDLCENGIVSPTLQRKQLYKNIYCAMCAENSINQVPLVCDYNMIDRTFAESIYYVLDHRVMHTIENVPSKKPRGVCVTTVTNGGTKNEVCRTIHCPSGKIHNARGECVLVGSFISSGEVFVPVKLTPDETIDFNTQVTDQEKKLLVQNILISKPWSNAWRVKLIRRRRQANCSEKSVALIHLEPLNKDEDAFFRDVNKYIQLPWKLNWKNKTYKLSQAFIEYEVKYSRMKNQRTFTYIPTWQVRQSMLNISTIYSGCGKIEWDPIFATPQQRSRGGVAISRLYFCDQIEMIHKDFTLGPDNTYLYSNLTTRVLFDMEFDLIETRDGLHARVCRDDTIFYSTKANGARVLKQPVAKIFVQVLLGVVFLLYGCFNIQLITS